MPPPKNFSDSERDALAQIAKEHEHRKWLGAILLRWSKWIAAVALGVTVTWDALSKIIQALGPPR